MNLDLGYKTRSSQITKLKHYMKNGKKLHIALAIPLIYRTALNPSLHKERNEF